MLTEKSPQPILSYLIYTCCAIAFATVPFGLKFGRDIFYVASYISFIAIVLNLRYYTLDKLKLVVSLSFLAFGLGTTFWLIAFKQPGAYIDIYRSYMSTARLFSAMSVVSLVALNERLAMQKITLVVSVAVGLLVNTYALYQGLWLLQSRIELNFDRTTIVAYLLTAISLVMMQSILMLKIRYRLGFYIAAFILSYSAIILTGTRAAMIAYPALILLTVIVTKNIITVRHKIAVILLVPVLLTSTSLVFKDLVMSRIHDFERNIIAINDIEAENSVFSRVWMQVVAIRTGSEAPLGQSAEQRASEAMRIIQADPQLYNAKRYLTVHMHNEILETWSLKGIWGVVLLLAFYGSLTVLAFRLSRNAMLFGLTVAMIIYGLSDVIFFSTEATATFLLAIIASILSMKKNQTVAEQPIC
ncbi:O-antigen ligase family protein [Erwinia amylovora]|uniref:O-antigen ligase n=3 Tax=Erwinia amylovora TaxID=552 RepID=A0A830ZXF4_ERWAM|nr:O-antigen ligase family protein [Erwinia amylovora]CDK13715.1 O-antigen ligase [Erwinia amylovora LA635]CDK17082.1 O-antigen ligase [Erwinia amylovora LA636]CDK20451.1 O-antigen ligase [Erwinia amylovora LA637]ATZ10060.1 ligase [Erwinia amylovora]EKV55716.1 O-antigen ligase [Erwinia amylovora ACW56400]